MAQVKKRCRWLSEFSSQNLARVAGTSDDPFGGVAVDINGLGEQAGAGGEIGNKEQGDLRAEE